VIFYLHGFASSPGSTKVRYFSDRLREQGLMLVCPNFNEPDFKTLTMTRMLDQLERQLPPASGPPVMLMGSSLGGTLAILAAARAPSRVERLVLLAPAVMFAKPGHHLLPPERIEEWRRRGSLPFFHYAANEQLELDYAFYEDSLRYDAFKAVVSQPPLMFPSRRPSSGIISRRASPGRSRLSRHRGGSCHSTAGAGRGSPCLWPRQPCSSSASPAGMSRRLDGMSSRPREA